MTDAPHDVAADFDRLIAALEHAIEDLQAAHELRLDALRDEMRNLQLFRDRLTPPELEPCCRCGQPFGYGGHGPGFCIDRRTESERQQEKHPGRARKVVAPVVLDGGSAPRTGRLSDIVAQLQPLTEPEALEEAVRDAVCDQRRPFRENVLMERLGVSRTRARELVLSYVERGWLRHVSGAAATARYEYVPPPNTAPNVRPRGDEQLRRSAAGSVPVAGTGKSKVNGSITGTRRPGRTQGAKKK